MKKLISKVDFWTTFEVVCWAACILWTLLVAIGCVNTADGMTLIQRYSWSFETAGGAILARYARLGGI